MAHAVADTPVSTVLPATGREQSARKYAVKVIGTFFLVFTVAAASLSRSSLTPLAAGAALMVMIYAGGHISGGHYNPAVTMAALWRGAISGADAIGYWIAQLLSGAAAGWLALVVVNPPRSSTLRPSGHALMATVVVEFLFTFALCFVMLNVATSRRQAGNSFFGLAIGFTVTAGGLAAGGISGGAFNPAVSLGGAAADMFAWSTLWVYVVSQMVAGLAAGLVFLAIDPGDT
jgi:aquaporin Z